MKCSNLSCVLILGALVLSACGEVGSDADNTDTSEGGVDRSTTVSSVDWSPVEPADIKVATPEERIAWRAEYLQRRAVQSGIQDVPAVELIRWSESHEEYDVAHANCLTEAGFPARLSYRGGGIVFDPGVPPEQDEALNLAMYVCEAKYTGRPEIMTDFDDEQLGVLWDYWTEAYIPCLEGNGVRVAEEPPTRESFIADFYTESRWWAEDWVPLDWGERRLTELYQRCPVYFRTEYLFGS